MRPEGKDSHIQRDVRRGALVNSLGLVGRLAGPAFLVVIARLYGPDSLGIYLTAAALVETSLALLVAGFKDGALIFVARHADDERERPLLYEALANAMGWSLLFATLIIIVTFTLGDVLILRLYQSYGDQLLTVLMWMTPVLPLMTFERVVLGATQGLKIMKYEALVGGGVRPFLLLTTASLFWLASPDVYGLAAAYATTQVVAFIISGIIYGREFEWPPLWQATRRIRIHRELIAFAFPQNVNATFDRFITNIDVIMLGLFGFSASEIGFYGAGALIVRELRQIKLVFSSAFSPHVVRLFKEGNLDYLARTFATTSRWIATPMVPALIGVAVLRSDLLAIVHPDFATPSAAFMLYLLAIPYLQGSFGLAANVLVMAGRSKLNLLNNSTAGASNILLNVLLIPPLGLVGAAAASGLTAGLKALLELAEMRYLLRVRVLVSQLYKPHLAGLAAAVSAGLLAWVTASSQTSIFYRLALVAGALLIYWVVLYAQGIGIRRTGSVLPTDRMSL